MIRSVRGWLLSLGMVCTVLAVDSCPGAVSEPPPLDPGVFIGVPSLAPSRGEGRGAAVVPASENIPTAEPVAEENIPTAVPVSPEELAPANTQAVQVPVIPKASQIPVDQNKTQVAILCYHDFSEEKPVTEMRIRTSVFRRQMQALKDAGMPVITLKEFREWKNGDRRLPEYCVMITVDDGWKSLYTDAFPVLKEMEFPFTVFPYTNYLTGRGASLSIEQVKEMVRAGATLGSHSTSHLYPSAWKRVQRKGQEAYSTLIDREIGKSREWLQANFNVPVEFYCYPGGYHTPEMIEKLPTYGYVGAVTVVQRKTLHETDNWQIPRYVVFGNNPRIFANAVTFHPLGESGASGVSDSGAGSISVASMSSSLLPPPMQTVQPTANAVIADLAPVISIDLSNERDVNPDSIVMMINGLGKVPASYDPVRKMYSWKANRPFRVDTVTVFVSWKTFSSSQPQSVRWQFGVSEPKSHYVPANVVK